MKHNLSYTNIIKQSLIFSCLVFSYSESHATNNVVEEGMASNEQFCSKPQASKQWIDKTRARTFSRMCKTVSWVDSWFGDEEPFDDEAFHGKITVGFKQGERDGFDPKVRIRIKSELPNVSKRLDAFIGRVEEDSYISDSKPNQDSFIDSGVRPADEDEAEWLLGLGYSDPNKTNNGFDFSLGAKISSGLNPYAKIRYKYLFNLPENHFLRTSQTLFWQDDDGYGTTSNLNYTYLLGQEDVLEWGVSAKFTEEDSQWQWVTGTTWFHQISEKRGISSRLYVRGEEENSESIPEYGISLTYRRPFLREWLYLETGIEHRWIRETAEEERDSSFRFGIQLEMAFGDHNRLDKTSDSKQAQAK